MPAQLVDCRRLADRGWLRPRVDVRLCDCLCAAARPFALSELGKITLDKTFEEREV
jgi:hypothetical protein